MSTGSSSVRKTTRKGFATEDVRAFQRMGTNLSVQNAPSRLNAPQMKSRTQTRIFTPGSLFSSGRTSESTSGFMGQFSNVSPEQMERLTQSLRKRQTNLRNIARQPGRRFLQSEGN